MLSFIVGSALAANFDQVVSGDFARRDELGIFGQQRANFWEDGTVSIWTEATSSLRECQWYEYHFECIVTDVLETFDGSEWTLELFELSGHARNKYGRHYTASLFIHKDGPIG